jgi:hypothetical protein
LKAEKIDMDKSIVDMVGEFLEDDPKKMGKLSSDINYRRMELLLLREIVLELRKLNQGKAVLA